MKYTIDDNGQIKLEDKKYWILSGELNNFNINDLLEILVDIENVVSGKYEGSSFSDNVIVVNFDRSIAKIEGYDGVIGEESTENIYKMLKEWYTILKEKEDQHS
ncbi:hypothetical protein [Flammeovirga kamogawensis]|uniref:Uncharacterized protein n=1 Tax=Flammeovirga kamogawensis TaxID=373891 RepID=A0ABX8H3H3_9BACT|nr:hypothetical protein [Flammeovirga kamogawensis]MBB6460303.1 hypothetical protein [Flammeovirga kamogawensis]QWG10112.1 hypothetical protein KM029_20740 [Flammeovirga kamogawensis]TRX65620.1 hypothetical protein EO216_24170 [Flammeovirga kamogawensis]